ncbi:MAG: hypothetical protein JNK35_01920, partial [Phycisphaerae bacterium]|nr:hypothetical protein [Phycisphaerae bacterium]
MKNFSRARRTASLRSRLPLAAGSPVVVEALEPRAMLAADFGRSVVFLADNVADGDTLASAFPGAEVVRLSTRGNFFEQVTAAL